MPEIARHLQISRGRFVVLLRAWKDEPAERGIEPLITPLQHCMTPFTLRCATLADLPEIMRLERSGFSSEIQENEFTFADRIRTFPQGCLVLSGEAGRLAGYLCAELWPYTAEVSQGRFKRDHAASQTHDENGEEVYISSMVIDPESRGTGLAKRLFTESLAYICSHFPALHSAILIVHPEWRGARKIYLASGFEEIGVVDAYFTMDGGTAPALVMRGVV